MSPAVTPSLDGSSSAEEIIRELVRRRADLLDHARGSLHQHLLGVHQITIEWSQPEHVQLAALLHSAYSTEAFDVVLFRRNERAHVRQLAGKAAERLVFAFCACRREDLLDAARDRDRAEDAPLATRWRDTTVRLDRREVAELLVIHAANLLEQAALPRGTPGRCLALASELLSAARDDLDRIPQLFDSCTRSITRDEETSLLRVHRALLCDREPAPSDLSLLNASPVGEPLLVAALRSLAARRGAEALSFAERASSSLHTWGVSWDKRLRLERWRELADFALREASKTDHELEASARLARRAITASRGSPARLWAHLDGLDALTSSATAHHKTAPPAVPTGEHDLPPRFVQYIAGLRTNEERPMLPFYPGLRVQPWHDPSAFPIVRELERLAPQIAAEAKAFDARGFQDEAEDIEREGRWGVLFLLEMGRRNEANLAKSPTLRGLLEQHRTLTTHAGLMYFSCLDPGSRVLPHRGPTNVRLRCHLGLDIPADCGIRVGGVTRHWEEGKCLVLDDSFTHEVWNDSARRRIVLVLDLWHPDLTEDEITLLNGLHRYGAANGSSAEKYWAKNDAALARAKRSVPTKAPPKDTTETLDTKITTALREGDLTRAGEHASRFAALCRGTRWYPVVRASAPTLPSSVPWSPMLTPSKLRHDIDQFWYLHAHGILKDELPPLIDQYEAALDTLRPLGEDARVPLTGALQRTIGPVYNRLLHVRETPRVKRALSDSWQPRLVEEQYRDSRPNVVVVDDFLSQEALESLRLFCLESTVWSINRYDHGRLGSFFRDGFNCPLLIQIAEELREAFPQVIGRKHPVGQLWGYKYATTQPRLPPHADFAAVNVNFWITPDEANLEPEAGGLSLYDVEAPKDWDFPSYNRNAQKIGALLAAKNATPTEIAYRQNRAVIFDSDLFHTTAALRFRAGYEHRRINTTVLYGDRRSS